MKAVIAILTLFVVFLVGANMAQAQYYSNYYSDDGYSGADARNRRVTDPYNRDRVFGLGYQKEFVNFGSKGPNYRIISTGAKSGYAGAFNLDTNSFRPQGRNPGRISNWDPRIRGFVERDVVVKLLPFANIDVNGKPIPMRGTVRIVQRGQEQTYSSPRGDFKSEVFVQLQNIPPLEDTQAYEIWLFDNEAEYPLSIGTLRPTYKLTGQLRFEIKRSLIPFDQVWITRETFGDDNPLPDEMLLVGEIEPQRDELLIPTTYVVNKIR